MASNPEMFVDRRRNREAYVFTFLILCVLLGEQVVLAFILIRDRNRSIMFMGFRQYQWKFSGLDTVQNGSTPLLSTLYPMAACRLAAIPRYRFWVCDIPGRIDPNPTLSLSRRILGTP